jgi:hypothetical protein
MLNYHLVSATLSPSDAGVVAFSLPYPLIPICGQTSLVLIIRSGHISPREIPLEWSENVCL